MEHKMRKLCLFATILAMLLPGAVMAGAVSTTFESTLKNAQAGVSGVVIIVSDKIKAENKTWGPQDVAWLKKNLTRKITRALKAKGLMDAANGARLEVRLEEVMPNRPTLRALNQRRHLDFVSAGLGGARMSARLLDADGASVGQVQGNWHETELDSQSTDSGVWFDARRAFDWFARRLARQLKSGDPAGDKAG